MKKVLNSLIDFCNKNNLGLTKIKIDVDEDLALAVACRGDFIFDMNYIKNRWTIIGIKEEKLQNKKDKVICIV